MPRAAARHGKGDSSGSPWASSGWPPHCRAHPQVRFLVQYGCQQKAASTDHQVLGYSSILLLSNLLARRCPQYMNCVKEYELDLRGEQPSPLTLTLLRSPKICYQTRPVASWLLPLDLLTQELGTVLLPRAGNKLSAIENLGATEVLQPVSACKFWQLHSHMRRWTRHRAILVLLVLHGPWKTWPLPCCTKLSITRPSNAQCSSIYGGSLEDDIDNLSMPEHEILVTWLTVCSRTHCAVLLCRINLRALTCLTMPLACWKASQSSQD